MKKKKMFLLAAIPRLKVVACNTMFGYKGKSPDARQLGSDVGVTHILEGSVLKAGNRIRLNAQLIETEKGSHLWAVRRAKELSRSPHSQAYAWEIVTLTNLGRLHEALEVSRQALELFPDGLDIIINHANACRLLGLREELAVALKRILELQPDFTAERWVAATGIFNTEEQARYVAELRQAGYP